MSAWLKISTYNIFFMYYEVYEYKTKFYSFIRLTLVTLFFVAPFFQGKTIKAGWKPRWNYPR
jgi:hypothetical protein